MIRFLAVAAVCALGACSPADSPSETNNASGTIPANEAETDLMSEGYSGERSSGPSGIADTNLGTTGPTTAQGSSPGPGGTGSGSETPAQTPPNE